jgi:excisionase family DNA binding protein
MRITYDSEVDAMYIKFSNTPVAKQQEINEDVISDLDKDNNIIGLELLDVTRNYGQQVLDFRFSLLGDLSKQEYYEYTTEEAAKILRVNKETVLRKIRLGDLKASRIGRSYRISKSELNKIMAP